MSFSARMQGDKDRIGKKQWIIQPPDGRCSQFARALNVSPLLAQVLINRGLTNTQEAAFFLRPKLTQLIAPEQMPGIEAALTRLKRAIKNKEKITIYGDYDVDGITGVAILFHILKLLGAEVDYYIPHRIDEGYGLNADAVRYLAKSGSKLIITVDCGITAFDSAELAHQFGLELIITDHHAPDAQLPKAIAVVHPALQSSYPNQDSSGSMIAFKLAWAIANQFSWAPTSRGPSSTAKLEPALRQFMINATSLAAIGTIADVVDLRGENRVLTSYGLKAIPSCKLCGIQALIESAGLTGQGLDSFHIGFRLAPMLNAAGRMGHARLAVELLTTDSPVRSMQIAEYLKEQNSQRQACERKIFRQACEMIEKLGLDHPACRSIVLARGNWHTGVIGIVASRIVDKYHRPTIMIGLGGHETGGGTPFCGVAQTSSFAFGGPREREQNDSPLDNSGFLQGGVPANKIAQGSARSIAGFDILGAIKACSQHLISFGGHKMAAGITIETSKIEQFTTDFAAYARENLGENDVTDKLHIDAVASLSQFTPNTVAQLQMLEPFGQGNPRPIFATRGVRLACGPRRVGSGGEHLQLAITDNTASIRCIGFRFGGWEKKLLDHEFFNVAYQPQINTYNNSNNVEFVITDIQFE